MNVNRTELCRLLYCINETNNIYKPARRLTGGAFVPGVQEQRTTSYSEVNIMTFGQAVERLRESIPAMEEAVQDAKEFLAEYDKGADALDLAEEDE